MRRWFLYHQLTILDVLRLWPTVQHHVIIVAGICLPILLLLGLKNGHVADLRKELLRSPTGRQVVFWSGQHGELMTPSAISQYEEDMPGVDLIIPEVQRLVSISSGNPADAEHTIDNVTLYSSRPGDPILAQHGGDVLDGSERGIVLVRQVADTLAVKTGQTVTVTIRRDRDGKADTASTKLSVAAVIEQTDKEGGNVAYVDIALLTAMEQYVLGFQVARLGWPAFKASAPDSYTSYLIFCEAGSPLTDEDLRTFRDRGYVVDAIDDEDRRTLYGLLKPESVDQLVVYQLAARGVKGWQPLNIAPGEITRFTEADDVAVPWNEPRLVDIGGTTHRVVGVSLPKRTWLKLYLAQKQYGFDYDAATFSIQFPQRMYPSTDPAVLQFAKDCVILLDVVACGEVTYRPDGSQTQQADTGGESKMGEGLLRDKTDESANAVNSETETTEIKMDGEVAAGILDKTVSSDNPPEDPATDALPKDSDTVAAVSEVEPEAESSSSVPPDTESETLAATANPAKPANNSPGTNNTHVHQPQTKTSVEGDHEAKVVASDDTPPLAIVPIDLLAHLCAAEAGTVEFDPAIQLFVPVPREPLFDKSRLYTNTIDDVPLAVRWLQERGFAVMSEVTRITEIHDQDRSLELLVLIVGAGVFLFGTVTVVSVLLDSTERKRGTLGILRVMGVSRVGLFYLVWLRATIIAVLAAGVTIGVGFAVSWFLAWQPPTGFEWGNWKPIINVIIRPEDLLVVAAGALACCGLGSLIPARKASRMDPFDAIVEGRFR
jgi:ABC-type lipoprotein release transport system permease subunit